MYDLTDLLIREAMLAILDEIATVVGYPVTGRLAKLDPVLAQVERDGTDRSDIDHAIERLNDQGLVGVRCFGAAPSCWITSKGADYLDHVAAIEAEAI